MPTSDRETSMTIAVAGETVPAEPTRRAEAGPRDGGADLRLLVDHLPGVLYLRRNDEHYSMLYLNDQVEDLTGYPSQAFLDRSVSFGELCHPDDQVGCDADIDRAVARNRAFHLVYRLRHRSRGWRWVEEHGVGVHRDGELRYVEGFICDITSRRRLERRAERRRGQLEFDATHDSLTGLINRAEFDRRLERAVGSARQEPTEHTLCYLDLDHFKLVNDRDGHLAGDEVLRQVSRQLAAAMRARDTLARLGGDEFGLLLEHCKPEQGREVAATVLQTVRGARLFWKERDVVIGISIGVVPISATSASPAAVLRAADRACYAAKARGGDCVQIADDGEIPLGPQTAPRSRGLAQGVVALVLASACAVTQQQEVALGASTAEQVSAQLPLIRDAAVVSYITTLGNQLARVTDARQLEWHFAVVDSREVNAFALPGGWVYVNRGLIERAATMSELAGVLGHEIGHITQRHSVEQMQQAQGANVGLTLVCTLTKVCESGAGQAAIGVTGSALFAKFSRTDEAEADLEAVATTIKAGISPAGVPAMFQTLLRERQSNPGAVELFFASHPLEERRIAATEAAIARYPASQLRGLTKDSPSFQALRRRLLALPPPPKRRTS